MNNDIHSPGAPLVKTRLIVFFVAIDAKGRNFTGNLDMVIDEPPELITRTSFINGCFENLKFSLVKQGFIPQTILPTNIIRLWHDQDEKKIAPVNLMPSRQTSPGLLPS